MGGVGAGLGARVGACVGGVGAAVGYVVGDGEGEWVGTRQNTYRLPVGATYVFGMNMPGLLQGGDFGVVET